MTLFIILALPLIGSLVRGTPVTEDIRVPSGSSAKLRVQSVGSVSSCVVVTNRNETLEYKPDDRDREIRKDIRRIFFGHPCSLNINEANSTHAGVWSVTVRGVPKKTNNYDDADDVTLAVFVFSLYIQETDSLFSNDVQVYDGHYISIKHVENYENLTACTLKEPEGKLINLTTEVRDNLQLFGQCGVRMKVNTNSSGTWELRALEDFVLHQVTFRVRVHQLEQKKKDSNGTLILQLVRGAKARIRISPDRLNAPKFCQIVSPSGMIVATSYKECSYNIEAATVQYEGVWLARYNMYGMIEPIEQQFKIETVDDMVFHVNVSYTRGDVRLLCRAKSHSATHIQSCSFVRPDGTMLYMTPVVSNERYSAHVSPTSYQHRNKTLECGIIIRRFESVDYGAWRCNLEIGYSSKMYGSILHVDNPEYRNATAKVRPAKIRGNVYVKRDDPFTIKCAVNSVLKYCWLRSPNGTAYSITSDKSVQSPSVLHYVGNGLAYGECGAEISAAVDSDNGEWSCLMGVADGGEEAAVVSVTVTETYLVAEQTEIAVSPRNDTVLSCRILPRMLDRVVHYCRWIRPDGYGIYNDISHRYTASGNYSHCKLVILNYRPKDDNGRWTCVAGLAGKDDYVEEAWAHITVLQQYDPAVVSSIVTVFIGISVCSAVLMLAFLIIVGYIVIRKRRILQTRRIPPAYSEHDCVPPKSSQCQFGTIDGKY